MKISDDPVFFNKSNTPQQPIKEQVAIMLFQFGHYGNAVSLQNVANWAAILCPSFMWESVHFPTAEEKEEAKVWVELHSCKVWRNEWCLVDGTLILLYAHPFWYGKNHFNQKCNYSLNVQIVSLPNLCIIDFGYGHTGNTQLAQEHDTLLEDGEWVWAHLAYLVLSIFC
ncbi:hypothetical protein BJV74DRAFT_878740 [Russula compacta]|nr:hypothetical protein BJV74DRAFT_878740 [Russula compacta]